MDDITDRVTFEFANAFLARDRRMVTMDAYLVNTSDEVLVGSLKIRVLSLRAPACAHAVSVTNADNGERRSNAVWDFSTTLDHGRLRPGERSKAKRLEFQLTDVPPTDEKCLVDGSWTPRGFGREGFVNFDAKVLGHSEK